MMNYWKLKKTSIKNLDFELKNYKLIVDCEDYNLIKSIIYSKKSNYSNLNLVDLDLDLNDYKENFFLKFIIRINLNKFNFNNLSIIILRFSKLGFKNFLINFEDDLFSSKFKEFNLTYSKILNLISKQLFKLIQSRNLLFYFNLPHCIFQNHLLKPNLRFNYSNNMINMINNYNLIQLDNSILNKVYLNSCLKCRYYGDNGDNFEKWRLCDGIKLNYIQRYGSSEFMPLFKKNILMESNLNYIKTNFNNNLILRKAEFALKNLIDEDIYLNRRFVFVNSFPEGYDESSKERFVYYIYNENILSKDFEVKFNDNLNFFKKYFEDNNFLNSLFNNDFSRINKNKNKDKNSYMVKNGLRNENLENLFINYLKKSKEFAIATSLMGNDKIRDTFYFTIDYLSMDEKKQILNLFDLFNTNYFLRNRIRFENLWGIGIDFIDNKRTSIKIYNIFREISKLDILKYLNDIPSENKKLLLEFLNLIDLNKFNIVQFDLKFKSGKLYSKRLDFSTQYDDIEPDILINLLELDQSYFKDKELYTISFELYYSKETKEKLNIYWSLKNKL